MPPSPLELYTTKELIDELVRRQTFLGVIVHAEQELKHPWTGERTFQVHFNSNLDAAQAGRLLDVISGYMERENC
jgi:hypothetical protein